MISFLDAGVLIVAGRGTDAISVRALEILDDALRQFDSSPFIRLEILPKCLYHRKEKEAQFYREYFAAVSHWADDLEIIATHAEILAEKYGIAAMDALHVAAAIILKADEFVTTERPTKPLFHVTEIRVVSLVP